MFANLVQLVSSKPRPDYDLAFVKEVTVKEQRLRNPRLAKWILAGWLCIAVKNLLVIWAIDRWHVPFDALWINGPTVAMGLVITIVYYWW